MAQVLALNNVRIAVKFFFSPTIDIGSGITGAACKVWVKQRMCISGSRWKDDGASCVLVLRALKLTKGRWQQFWGYVMRQGCTFMLSEHPWR